MNFRMDLHIDIKEKYGRYCSPGNESCLRQVSSTLDGGTLKIIIQ